jgi:hypothetical protein
MFANLSYNRTSNKISNHLRECGISSVSRILATVPAIFLATVLAIFIFVATPLSLSHAQELQKDGKPALPSKVVGPQLIVWSQAQTPQPVPEPLPRPTAPEQRPTSKDVLSKNASQTFTGVVMNDRGRFVLKTPGNISYDLDDQQRVRWFEGKTVKLEGSLSSEAKTISITRIITI